MPQLTPEGDRISVHGLYSEDVSNFVMEDLMRLMLMYMDVKLLEDYYLRNIFIMDMKDLSVTHVMKTPPALMKKYILFITIQIHGSDYTKLYNDVPRHLLPTELGGESGSIKEHYEQFQDSIKSHHEWFMATENLKADESKRPKGQVSCNEMFGIEGSFRNLEVD
ncbi:hypothetical protein C0J52_01289 [Blattella germanica]|nr:hypothetical protein C0J52_01289 [Blattella germanica]